jgi:hypothetical protein
VSHLGCRHLSPTTPPTSTLGETSSTLQVLSKGPIVNVLNLHIIDLARKYHTHLQREIEKEEAREKEWKNSH